MDDEARDKIVQRILDEIHLPHDVEVVVDMGEEEDGTYSLDDSKPLVLLLGQITHEGVTSALSAAGRQYKQKYPESSIENWIKILDYFKQFNVREVLWKFNDATYRVLSKPQYEDLTEELLSTIAARRHVLFIHQDLLTQAYYDDYNDQGVAIVWKEGNTKVNALLDKHKLNVLPYAKNAEVTVSALEFIAQTEQGLLLRVYIPAGRMWANETDRMLQLFRDYLANVSKLKVRLDQRRTDLGIIYEFHCDSQTTCDLSDELNQFSHFMDLCISNPDQAQEILVSKDVAARDVADILTRYSKEAKRLNVDMKHDRERKVLAIRQKMESELTDVFSDSASGMTVELLIDSIVPQFGSIKRAIALDQNPLQITDATNVTFNFQPQIVQAIDSIVAQEIQGDVHLTKHDQDLLALIQMYAKTDAPVLASAVHELADTSAPKQGRLLAKQKLMKFLIAASSKIGDVATGVLQTYIEKQMGLS